MTTPPDAAQLHHMQMVSGVMLAGALAFLGLAHWVHRNHPGSLEVMAYLAIAVAVAAPIEVAFVDKVRKPPGNPVAHHITIFGILEAAALFCGGALMTAPNDWPLLAAVIPVGLMILRFPRAS